MIQTRTRGRILDVIPTDGSSSLMPMVPRPGYLQTREFSAGREVVLFWPRGISIGTSPIRLLQSGVELLDDATNPPRSIWPLCPRLRGSGPASRAASFAESLRSAVGSREGTSDDPLPEDIGNAHGFPHIRLSLERIHFPEAGDDLTLTELRQSPYHRRLIFEEFFSRADLCAPPGPEPHSERCSIRNNGSNPAARSKRSFHFIRRRAQKRVLKEIVDDLKAPYPMNRCCKANVGSGKTIVAFEATTSCS